MKCEAINNDIERLQETKETNGASDEERTARALFLSRGSRQKRFKWLRRDGEVPKISPRVDRPFVLRQSVSASAKK